MVLSLQLSSTLASWVCPVSQVTGEKEMLLVALSGKLGLRCSFFKKMHLCIRTFGWTAFEETEERQRAQGEEFCALRLTDECALVSGASLRDKEMPWRTKLVALHLHLLPLTAGPPLETDPEATLRSLLLGFLIHDCRDHQDCPHGG